MIREQSDGDRGEHTHSVDLPSFQILSDHAAYRPAGRVTLEEGVRMITAAISRARERKQRNLLIDITGLTGFESPGLGRRYFLMEEWARVARAEGPAARTSGWRSRTARRGRRR